LHQERSRRTRHELVRTALALWTERGFEHGIEQTTVEEIAQAAGVTKGSFYFHFAHKEDVLLEMGIEAEELMGRARPAHDVLGALMTSLARRVDRAPPAAVARAVAEVSRRAHDMASEQPGSVAFANTFTRVVAYGVARGELPARTDAADVGALLQAVAMDTVMRWAKQGGGALGPRLQHHTDLVLAGVAAVLLD
jgi:AcrR family transcriptional regulator